MFKDRRLFKISVVLMCILLVIVGIYNSWRLFGFDKCMNPNDIIVTRMLESEELLILEGATSSSALKYIGYISKVEDSDLYIGLRFGLLSINSSDYFRLTVPMDRTIKRIIFTNGKEEKVIRNEYNHFD